MGLFIIICNHITIDTLKFENICTLLEHKLNIINY